MKSKVIELKNGGKLIYCHSKANKSTAVEVGFSVGANQDKKKGTAHFLEHTLFKKTASRSNEEINRDRNKIAFMNASTGLDFLVVKFSRTNKLIEKSFEFASDLLLNSVIDDEFMASEKGVICEELKMTLDSEKRDVYVYGYKQAVLNAKFASAIVGESDENIMSIEFKDLINFKKKHFVGNNFVVSVVSSLSLGKIKKLVNKFFVSKIKFDENYKKKESYYKLANADKKSSLKVYELDQEKVSVLISFKFDKNEREIYENDLSFAFLSKYISGAQGNLFLRLRNKGLVYRLSSDISCFSKNSLFNISFETSKDKIKSIIEELKQEVAYITQNEIDAKITQEYKDNLIYREDEKTPLRLESKVHFNLIDLITEGKAFELQDKAKRKLIKKINAKSIKNAANEIFNKQTEVYVTLLGNTEKSDIQSLKQIKEYFLVGE